MLKEELAKVLADNFQAEEKYLKSLLKRTIIKLALLNKEKSGFKLSDIAAYAYYLVSENGEYPSYGDKANLATPKILKLKTIVENYNFFVNAKAELIQKIKDIKSKDTKCL